MRKHGASAVIALLAAPAVAQQNPSAFDPQGLRLGGFIASPSIELSEEYNTNIREEEDGEDSSFITRISPELQVRSDFNRHAIALETGAEAGFFHSSSDDDYLDYFARSRGRIDVTRDATISGLIGYVHGSEGRGDVDSVSGAAEPTEFDDFRAELSGQYKGGLFRVRPFALANYRSYDDTELLTGDEADESDRDRWRREGGLELGYEFLRGYEAFVRGAFYEVEYDDSIRRNGGPSRDSDGFRGLAGVNIDLTRLVEMSAGAGYETRSFESNVYEDYDGFTASVDLDWYVTRLSTVSLGVERTLGETSFQDASHRVVTEGALAVRHELRRNLTLEAAFGYAESDYQNNARSDDIYTAGLGVEWIPMRNVAVEGQYRFSTRESNQNGEDFDLNQVFVGVRYAF